MYPYIITIGNTSLGKGTNGVCTNVIIVIIMVILIVIVMC